MEPAPPESKRPRLTSTSSWSTLPHPVPPPHHPSHASHAPPYHPTHPFTRPPESPAPLAQHHHDDRRHHEPEAFPPMQDHQRHHPPPSPAQQAHYHYPMREPMVKRDPNDEPPLPQLRRPNSTGHPVENLPPTTHAPHHRPVQPPPEPPRQMSYENGPPMAQSPNAYRPPPTAFSVPPTPVPHHQHYDGGPYGHGGHVPPPMSYHPQIDIQQASSAKRKATRASQACDSCRQLKAKCDETKPCKTCRERNINCVFRDPQPKQTDKANADIMDYLAGLRDEMVGAISKVERRLTHVERAINSHPNATADCKIESIEGEDYHDGAGPMDRESLEDDREGQPIEDSNGGMDTEAAVTTLQKWEHNDSDEKPGPPVAGKTKLPANHTTSAGLLLKWTSIHDLVKRHLVAEHIGYVEEFPIRQEKLRGLLRVCGSGEGSTLEPAPHADHSDHQRADNILTEYQDDNSEAPSPAPNSEVWGQTGGLSPAPGAVYRGGVINMDGNPDFSAPTVLAYVESFKNNILNMHPIMILEELDALVVLFLKEIPQHTNKSNMRSSSNSKFVSQPTSAAPSLPEAVGSKRKRSPGGDETMPSFNFYKPGHPFRSITSAVVLLVCALGKICLNKDRIPDVVTDYSEPQPHRSPSMRNGGAMSPIHGSPPGFVSHSQSSGLPSPQDYDRTMPSRRTSMQGNGTGVRPTQMKRNYDVIPGLEYFALATDIMGSHLGGMSLKHVYAWVLAGLYHGQLARAVESWAYIKQGCTVLQEIMRTSIYRFQEIKLNHGYVPVESRRDNQLLLAYWTCLQLESDILAELPLSQSPIMQHEDNMPYPNMGFVTGHGYKDEVCASYFAQLHLRRQLNEIHSHLYNPEKIHRPQSPETIDEGIEVLQTQLKTSRNIWVPPTFRWNEDEPAATDILSARLRAKYWGSQVIIYRPFVRHILEKAPIPYGAYKNPALPQPDSFKSLNIHVGNQPIPDGVDPRTLNYARLGIEALMESTSAFHGMPRRQRIIVTNIFGTAHAQWGNLLTLAACYQDPILSRFVEVETLAKLFNRTIEFFDVIAHRSSPLRSERNILYGLACDLRLIREDPPLNSSFSSMTSSTTPATTVTSHPGEMYPPSGSAAFAGHHPHTSRP